LSRNKNKINAKKCEFRQKLSTDQLNGRQTGRLHEAVLHMTKKLQHVP